MKVIGDENPINSIIEDKMVQNELMIILPVDPKMSPLEAFWRRRPWPSLCQNGLPLRSPLWTLLCEAISCHRTVLLQWSQRPAVMKPLVPLVLVKRSSAALDCFGSVSGEGVAGLGVL